MDAVEYLRAFYKMCDSNKYCSSCEAIGVCQNDCEKAEQMVEIVEKWAEEHPAKTRQSEYLKTFPNVILEDGLIPIKPCEFEPRMAFICVRGSSCLDCRRKYWSEEIE